MENPTPVVGNRYELIRPRSTHKGIVIELTGTFQSVDGVRWSYDTVSAPRHLPKSPGSVTESLLINAPQWWRYVEPTSNTAGLARQALIEQLPELYDTDDVAAMSDDEAIREAISAAVMEG